MKKATSKTNDAKRQTAEEAAELAARYRLVLTAHPKGGFVGSSVEMPLVLGHGKTEADCLRDTREALIASIAHLLESGERPPAPAHEGKREVQINIRLTSDERVRIEEQARQAGFRSISDYVRRAALRGVG